MRHSQPVKGEKAGPTVTGIVGSPAQVASSLSPILHNAAFRALDMDWIYLTFGMEADSVVRGIRGLASAGVRGMNVTLPHKVLALQAMDVLSGGAEVIGAVNTVEVRRGGLTGWNTDGDGLVRFLRMDAGAVTEGSRVLVIGAGGSARAVVFALGSSGAKSIHVLARDPERARPLETLAGSAEFRAASVDSVQADVVRQSDIIINATPVGQRGEDAVIPTEHIRPGAVVVDLVYRPAVTPLIHGARLRGAVAHSGLGMLLHQAALAFEIWTGVPPPMDVMSAAAISGLKLSSGSRQSAS